MILKTLSYHTTPSEARRGRAHVQLNQFWPFCGPTCATPRPGFNFGGGSSFYDCLSSMGFFMPVCDPQNRSRNRKRPAVKKSRWRWNLRAIAGALARMPGRLTEESLRDVSKGNLPRQLSGQRAGSRSSKQALRPGPIVICKQNPRQYERHATGQA